MAIPEITQNAKPLRKPKWPIRYTATQTKGWYTQQPYDRKEKAGFYQGSIKGFDLCSPRTKGIADGSIDKKKRT
jgi:hypothetical protein